MERPDPSRSADLARVFGELGALHELIASLHSRVSLLEGRTAASSPEPGPVASGEGAVRVDAGPFADLGALLDFERSLTSLPAIKDVNLHGFQAGRATLEVCTARPAQIIEDLHSLPEPPVSTEVSANGTVVLTVAAAPGEKGVFG